MHSTALPLERTFVLLQKSAMFKVDFCLATKVTKHMLTNKPHTYFHDLYVHSLYTFSLFQRITYVFIIAQHDRCIKITKYQNIFAKIE